MLYWLMSDEGLQVRMIRAIREARTPLTARAPREPREEGAAPDALSVADGVATIRVEGVLTPAPDMQAEAYGEPNTTYPDLRAALSVALSDRKVKRIEWSIDSPGGAVDGLFALLDDIADARASGKPMSVIAENAHSAAYGIAAAVGSITARSRTSSFGSVGVATTGFVQGGLCGKAVDITNTDAPEKRPNIETPEGRAVVTKYLDQIAGEFMQTIADGRGVTRDHVALKFGRGSSMLATAAKEAGLIDRIDTRVPAHARTLTYTLTSDTVRDRMADPQTPAPASPSLDASAPVPEANAVVAVEMPSALTAAERAELAQLRADRDARDATELRSLVTELVALGAETPATAFANGVPVPRLASEGLPALRERVAALRARPVASAPVRPPVAAGDGEEALEDFERRDAAKIKDPDARARFVASRLARKQK